MSETQEKAEEAKAEPAKKKEVEAKATKEVKEKSEKKPAAKKAAKPKAKKTETAEKVEVVEEAKAEVVVEVTKEETPKEAPKAKKESKPKKEEIVVEEFDWDAVSTKGFGDGYTAKEKEDMATMYEGTLNTITEREVVEATVVSVSNRDVILNIGFKSDGLVSASEFRDTPDLKQGDVVEVYVDEQENSKGQLVLSRRKAKIVKAWENIQSSHDDDTVIEGFVKRRTKGGLIVDIFGVEAFLPGSQIDVKPIRDFDIFVGKSMEVKVVKINYTNDNVVVSHKILIEKDLEKQRVEILNNLEKGQVLEGVIKNMTNFGVFIDLGGVDGLLHITDISWGRINHPEEVLKLDETVKVVVLEFDEDKKRISLGMKQLTSHPWDALAADLEVGAKVKGKIVNVADYGAFLEIQPGVEGLIHVSEMSWSQHLRNPSDFMNVGDEMEAVVLTLDRDERKMSLGIKQLTEDPWLKTDVVAKYGIGTQHTGVVRNLTNFGLFIELEEGIDGLVHVSDLSWTKKIKHPSEFIAVGGELEVQVLELDVDNRKLALGHKQLEENPWDTFETVFEIGTVHKCTINNKTDKGSVLELPYGIEGFVNTKNLTKEDGSKPVVGDTLDFKVIEFSKGEKRILLSHTATYKEDEKAVTPKKKSTGGKKKASGSSNQEATSSLGDLSALSALKEQMEKPAAKPVAKPAAKKAPAKKKAEAPVAEEAAKVEEAPKEEAPKAKKAPAAKAKKEAKADEAPKAEKAEGESKE
jgi:small subunit ribosomal protein S1